MSVNTKATPHLFTLRQRVYAVACHTCHPDTNRIVILFEKPSVENRGQGLSVSARWKDGKYYGVITGGELPIKLQDTVWMESPLSEGPFYVANFTAKKIQMDQKFDDINIATEYVNGLNMASFGEPTYTVVDQYGILIDHEGFYTQHSIAAK